MIKCGEYNVYHKEDAGKASSHRGGPWFFEPENWQGAVYSEGYQDEEEALDACIAWREIAGDEEERTQREYSEKQRQDSLNKTMPAITDLIEAGADPHDIAALISGFRADKKALLQLVTFAIEESLRVAKG